MAENPRTGRAERTQRQLVGQALAVEDTADPDHRGQDRIRAGQPVRVDQLDRVTELQPWIANNRDAVDNRGGLVEVIEEVPRDRLQTLLPLRKWNRRGARTW